MLASDHAPHIPSDASRGLATSILSTGVRYTLDIYLAAQFSDTNIPIIPLLLEEECLLALCPPPSIPLLTYAPTRRSRQSYPTAILALVPVSAQRSPARFNSPQTDVSYSRLGQRAAVESTLQVARSSGSLRFPPTRPPLPAALAHKHPRSEAHETTRDTLAVLGLLGGYRTSLALGAVDQRVGSTPF